MAPPLVILPNKTTPEFRDWAADGSGALLWDGRAEVAQQYLRDLLFIFLPPLPWKIPVGSPMHDPRPSTPDTWLY